MSQTLGIYGASGFGREVMPLARTMSRQCVFVDDGLAGSQVNGSAVMSWDDFLALEAEDKKVAIAIGDGRIRESIALKCGSSGMSFSEIRSTNAVLMDEVELGVGAIICPFVTITSNVRIGRHFHANLYSYVAHDCVIGDFVTFAPNVHCNGNVHVGDHAYIGTGAVLRQGRRDQPLVIGAGATVGMGAVVTKDVAPGMTVVGNPARVMEKL